MNEEKRGYCETMLKQRDLELTSAESEINEMKKSILVLEQDRVKCRITLQTSHDENVLLTGTNTSMEKRLQQHKNLVCSVYTV